MKPFAKLPLAERALIVNEAASRLGLVPLIVEKDFWVCWTLARIFEVEAVAPHVIFKGGTSLSKVFGAIQRFSQGTEITNADFMTATGGSFVNTGSACGLGMLRRHRPGRVSASTWLRAGGTRRRAIGQRASQARAGA